MFKKYIADTAVSDLEHRTICQLKSVLREFRKLHWFLPVEIEELEQLAVKKNVLFDRSLVYRQGSLLDFYHGLGLGTFREERLLQMSMRRDERMREGALGADAHMEEGITTAYADFFGPARPWQHPVPAARTTAARIRPEIYH